MKASTRIADFIDNQETSETWDTVAKMLLEQFNGELSELIYMIADKLPKETVKDLVLTTINQLNGKVHAQECEDPWYHLEGDKASSQHRKGQKKGQREVSETTVIEDMQRKHNPNESEITMRNLQIKSIRAFQELAGGLQKIEENCGIRETRITLESSCFVCPDLKHDVLEMNHPTPMGKLLVDLFKIMAGEETEEKENDVSRN